MLLVFVIAVAIGSARAWNDVAGKTSYHLHIYAVEYEGEPCYAFETTHREMPFYPRFVGRLVGLPWKSVPPCLDRCSRPDESCELAHPELFQIAAGKEADLGPTPELLAAKEQMKAQLASEQAERQVADRDPQP